MVERVSSGIDGLDALIEGGFPKGSVILVCGNPGTGKTILSAQFLYKGMTSHDENAIYVSFGESRKNFYEYMRGFGFDFEKLESEGRFAFLEMITGKKAVPSESIKMVLEKIYELEAKRLVIDPITAISQAYAEKIDVRTMLHTILGKLIRKTECTTLMIVEVPVGNKSIGIGLEEFVVDGVILLKRRFYDERLLRELEVIKLRGTRVLNPLLTFTLDNGFHVFPPAKPEIFETYGKYEIIPHGKDHFSTGIGDLDRLIGKTFVKGSFELIEIEKDVAFPLERLIAPTICKFLNQDYGVAVIPPQGLSAQAIEKIIEPHVNNEVIQRKLKVADFRVSGEALKVPQYVLPLRGEFIVEDMKRFWDAITELRESTNKPVLTVVGYDTLEYIYGQKETLKILGEDIARTRNYEDLRINIVRPTVEVAEQLAALANMHLKICQINGAIFLYGIKPKTQLQNIQVKVENQTRKIKLKPLI